MNFDYYGSWRNYAFPAQTVKFARAEEIKALCHPVDFNLSSNPHAGLPLISDGKHGYVIDNEDMSIIFGGTGSGKTRYVATEIICNLAQRGDSMIIMDQKGSYSGGKELAPYVRYTLEQQGYKCYFLNFKDLNGDKMHILGRIWDKWHEEKYDEANLEIDKFLNPLLAKANERTADPYWNNNAVSLLRIIITLICATCKREELNFASICSMINMETVGRLMQMEDLLPLDAINKSTLSNLPRAYKTLTCVVNSASYLLGPFIRNKRLMDMISHDTIDLADLYKRKTALFIILPEDQVYNDLAGIMMGQIADYLVDVAYRSPESTLPKKVNFIADEFSNYFIDKMDTRISTVRSKNIRWYLFSQGLEQMKVRYSATTVDTILANCSNILFLSSPDLTLMERLSSLAGLRTDTISGQPESLLSVQDLAALKKEDSRREIYYSCRGKHFVTELPDISCYKGYQDPQMLEADYCGYVIPVRPSQPMSIYSLDNLLLAMLYNSKNEDITYKKIKEILEKPQVWREEE